jgi:putative ABC transport system permease protein
MKEYPYSPPKLFLRFFRWFCHPKLRDHIEGDLMELYAERLKELGEKKADIKFIIDVLLLCRPGIIRSGRADKWTQGSSNLNYTGMFKSYWKITWRNILHKKIYAGINVFGLSLGLCACIVIYVIISYEFSFDTFHPGKERIYRVMGDVTEGTGEKLHFCRLPLPLSQHGRAEISGLDQIATVIPYYTKITIPFDDKSEVQFESTIAGTHFTTTVIAESQYFDIFKYEWLAGNPASALKAPFTVLLTESKARMYFGDRPLDDILGKQIVYDDSLAVTVSGIVRDWDNNTDLGFTDFISFNSLQGDFLKRRFNPESWSQGDLSAWIFTKLSASTSPQQVEAQLADVVNTHAASQIKLVPWLQPLSAIHFDGDVIENPIRTAHMPTLYSLMGIAIFILILAVVNFINLSTAQSIQRAKEVGVRKVLGSSRRHLVVQFLMETLMLTLLAVFLAVAMAQPVLNGFRSFIPAIPEAVSLQFFKPSLLWFLLIVTILTTILSGLYPAKVLSAYLPALNLRGSGARGEQEKWLLRKGLIVFQFAVSLVFIISSLVIANQLSYTRKKDLGFTSDAIVTVQTPWGSSRATIAALKQKIEQIPNVERVALEWLPPMTENSRGMKLKFNRSDVEEIGVTQVAGNEDFIPLYQITLLSGRNLLPSDSVKEFVINESLSKIIGANTPDEAIGRILYWNDKPYPVVGVAADFHTSSFHDPITTLCIINRPDREGSIAVKLGSRGKQSSMIKTALSQMAKEWKEIYPDAVFNFRFYDESLAMLYAKDQQTAMLINTSMSVAIFISLIGLFGLTLFTTERRAKEIGIRKILGASVANISVMLSRDFVVLVIMAIFIASPIAWYFMHKWLQGFAYHVNVSWWVFVLAGLSAVVIALATVSFQAIKAAVANPADSLRSE